MEKLFDAIMWKHGVVRGERTLAPILRIGKRRDVVILEIFMANHAQDEIIAVLGESGGK